MKGAQEPLWQEGCNTHLSPNCFRDELGGGASGRGGAWCQDGQLSSLVSEWGPPTLGSLTPGVWVWVLTMGSPELFYHADMT